jgi:simple sugar transport system permease protein
VYTAGITPETTLVFKAIVVIAVCLLQAPKFRQQLRRRRRGAAPIEPTVPAPGVAAVDTVAAS